MKFILITNRYKLIDIFHNFKSSEIFCEKNSFAQKYCEKKKISYKTYKTRSDFHKIILKNLNNKIFTNGCKFLFPKKILSMLKFKAINIHPSLLPNYRGQFVIDKIFYNREKYIGATIHEIDNGVDTGKILHQKKILYKYSNWIIDLYHKIFLLEKKVFEEYFFKNKKINLKIKKKDIIKIRKKNVFSLKELNKYPIRFIQSQCVPNKYLKIRINSIFKKILYCEKKKFFNLKKLNKSNYFQLSENDYIIRCSDCTSRILLI